MYDLNGKNAIVTGGASGIGYCIIRDLLKSEITKCVILDLNPASGEDAVERFTEEFGEDRVYFIKCDVGDVEEFECVMKSAMVILNSLDIFINNAGVLDEVDWKKVIDVNVNGVINGTTLAMKYMSKNNGGHGGTIVNMSSIAIFDIFPGCAIYTASKHFVFGYTKSWSIPYFYDKTGIRMMVMCPGLTDTTLIKDFPMDEDDKPELYELLAKTQIQKPDSVSKGVISILKHGENDTVWICKDDKDPYQIIVQSKTEMFTKF